MTAATGQDRHTLCNKIPMDAYAKFMDKEFGEQVLEGLELLSMSKPVDEEGYYYCFSKNSFTGSSACC
jgi:hypothetical protein